MTTHSLAMHQLIALSDVAAHTAPMLPLTPTEAHETMRVHVACRAKSCPRKAAAQDTLVEAGRMVLAENKPR